VARRALISSLGNGVVIPGAAAVCEGMDGMIRTSCADPERISWMTFLQIGAVRQPVDGGHLAELGKGVWRAFLTRAASFGDAF